MNDLYRITGVSKQGFHQWLNHRLAIAEEQANLLPIIRQLREDHPRMSCRQFYFMIKPQTVGRDRFEDFCHNQGFKITARRSKYKTTDSRGIIRFPNLLLTLNELTGVNQLWVSDITYYEINGEMYYLTFITDLFHREIVGYSASNNLSTAYTSIPAVKMAIAHCNLKIASGLIFHSDGGGQYYCKEFVSLTKRYGIRNSMGKSAWENPHAERVNGTIKNDYLIPYQPRNFRELKRMLTKAVNLYNTQKPHQSLNRNTPREFKRKIEDGLLTKKWVFNKKKKVSKKEKIIITIK